MSTKLGKIIADFQTSLATEIAVGGTTATLQSATDDDGVALPAGVYFFTLDVNNSQKEHIVATLSGTSLTGISSVSRQGAQTSGVVRKHRVGASVEITDFAHIKYINDLLDGTTYLNASTPLRYDGTATINNDNQLATKAYVDGVAVAGAPDASTTVKGIVEIATGAELAAGTGTGGTGAVIVPAGSSFKNASAGAGDANKVPVLNASGVLDQTFLDSARTWGAVQSFTADNAQITTDPDSGNDAVRKSYADDTYLLNIFGDGSDGDVTIGTNTTLVRDMFYNNLTLPGSFTINTAGFRIYVRGTFTRSGTGYVFNEGGAGGAGANGTSGGAGAGGTAGTAAPGVTVPAGLAGVVGGAGGASSNNNGNAGTAGLTAALCSTSTAGVAGGAGGAANPSGLTGGAAGGAGSATQAVPPRTPSIMELLAVANGTAMGLIRPAAGSGSGGGGASGNASAGSNFGGGGGGSGASGGHVSVNAYALNDTGSGTMFRANGAVGGNGGNGYVSGTGNQGAGGGGAGSGGNGGSIEIVCKRKTGTCTMTVSGGSPGSVGTGASFGSGSGSNGAAGNTGNSGFSLCLQI